MQWNALYVVTAKLTNMARCPMVISAISVLLAIKPLVSHLIVFIIVAMSVLSKFVKCCKRIVKVVAYEASAAHA